MADITENFVANSAIPKTLTGTIGGAARDDLDIEIIDELALLQLFAKKGKGQELAKLLNIDTSAGKAATGKGFVALPLAPEQWMLVANGGADGSFHQLIAEKIAGTGYVSEQSGSRVCFRISGKYARDLMSRGCRIDLHRDAVSPGFCAQTNMAQIGVLLHQLDDGPAYDLYVYSGFARSFRDWLRGTALQFYPTG